MAPLDHGHSEHRDYDERVHYLATVLRPVDLARRVLNAESEVRRLQACNATQAETIGWYRHRFGDTGHGDNSTDRAYREANG